MHCYIICIPAKLSSHIFSRRQKTADVRNTHIGCGRSVNIFDFFLQRYLQRSGVFHHFSHHAQAAGEIQSVTEALVGHQTEAHLLLFDHLIALKHGDHLLFAHGNKNTGGAKIVCVVENVVDAQGLQIGAMKVCNCGTRFKEVEGLCWASLVAQLVKNLPALWETWV